MQRAMQHGVNLLLGLIPFLYSQIPLLQSEEFSAVQIPHSAFEQF